MAAKTNQEEDLTIEEEPEEDEVAIAYDIAAYPSDLTLSVVHEMWHQKDIEIPDFQRNFVWSIKQASLLIDSFLSGLPVPQVFFYVDEQNRSQVIDGQQRIMSIVNYIDGYFGTESIQGKKTVFRLQGLDDTNPHSNLKFDDLNESQQRKLKSSILRAINIRQMKPKGNPTCIYHIFERLNTGGTPLKPQEIRNCVFRGGFVKKLRDLNSDKHWRLILGKKTLDRHQKDVELILRIFSMSYYFDDYIKPMKEFLNIVMEQERSGTSSKFKAFCDSFLTTTKLIIENLGEKCFHLRGPLNAAALDSVFCILLEMKGRAAKDLPKRYDNLKNDAEFKETTLYSTSDLSIIKRRLIAVRRHLLG